MLGAAPSTVRRPRRGSSPQVGFDEAADLFRLPLQRPATGNCQPASGARRPRSATTGVGYRRLPGADRIVASHLTPRQGGCHGAVLDYRGRCADPDAG
jgi:hypothetical protein